MYWGPTWHVDPLSSDDDMLRFEWSVRALAQEAPEQIALFPAFVCVADELALDFEEHHRKLADPSDWLSDEQAAAIASLDTQLAAMGGPANLAFWTDEALRDAPEWREVRRRAREVLTLMDWTAAPPPADRGILVGPDA